MDLTEAEEGTTRFLVPVQDPAIPFPPGSAPVFYNRRMEISRDATVLLVSSIHPTGYLDSMGATGARGLRIAQECGIPVTINDRDPGAYELIRRNADLCGLPIEVISSDVNVLLSCRRFDAVDLDPFGTPAPFLDSAIRGTGRYLFVTATDTAPLCGAHQAAGTRRYFASALNNEYHSETGLRILLSFAVREAVKYDKGIEPLFCFSHEHFIRIHLRLTHGAREADRTLSSIGFVLQCPSCPFRTEQSGILPRPGRCPDCGSELKPVGPLWMGSISDPGTLAEMEARIPGMRLGAADELGKLLSLCRQELDTSSHYDYHVLAKFCRVSPPPMGSMLDKIRDEGFAATRTHYSGTSFKSRAPMDVIYRALRGHSRPDDPGV
ncbi:MAG: tRNA (guanine(10)-N(2))-dimethyltransferase [Methanolinea sp.]|nr:tRNA (guanine(10)-N(2))-dimethyltransferase [Methanolinea sp.]